MNYSNNSLSWDTCIFIHLFIYMIMLFKVTILMILRQTHTFSVALFHKQCFCWFKLSPWAKMVFTYSWIIFTAMETAGCLILISVSNIVKTEHWNIKVTLRHDCFYTELSLNLPHGSVPCTIITFHVVINNSVVKFALILSLVNIIVYS